jgi:NADH-quinone oxidoreductase subunit H
LFFMMARWSWPRFRFDQLMTLSWKVMLPLGLVNLVAVAVLVEYQHGGRGAGWPAVIAMWGVALTMWIAAGVIAPLASDNRPRNVGQVSKGPLNVKNNSSSGRLETYPTNHETRQP